MNRRSNGPNLLALAVAMTLLSSCGKPSRIQGRVVDEAGRAVVGAIVKIDGSAFTAATDDRGRYSLDYAPGSLVIVFEKGQHVPDTLRVSLATKTYFPAQDIQLLSIPTEPGFYWISPTGYVPLRASNLLESYHDTGAALFGGRRIFHFDVADTGAVPVHGSGLRFVDFDPGNQRLFRLSGGARIADISTGPFGLDAQTTADKPDETWRSIAEGLFLRRATLAPGTYAYCSVREGSMSSAPVAPAFVFRVVAADSAARNH